MSGFVPHNSFLFGPIVFIFWASFSRQFDFNWRLYIVRSEFKLMNLYDLMLIFDLNGFNLNVIFESIKDYHFSL